MDKKAFDTEFVGDQGSKVDTIKSTEDILAKGGCKVAQTIYENGQEWHPTLPSHGEQKCIKCRCKVSQGRPINSFNLLFFFFYQLKFELILLLFNRIQVLHVIVNDAHDPFAILAFRIENV